MNKKPLYTLFEKNKKKDSVKSDKKVLETNNINEILLWLMNNTQYKSSNLEELGYYIVDKSISTTRKYYHNLSE